jgi:cell division protein ZapE
VRASLPERYRRTLLEHGWNSDVAQVAALVPLEELRQRLRRRARRERGIARVGRWLGWRAPPSPVRGVYLWGEVGRGKTLLMDLFHASLTLPSRRVHFHHFMRDVHDRLGHARALGSEDPLTHVGRELAAESAVLCLDELSVTDIADAMILGGLLAALFANGTTLVLTANVPPGELYAGGLQRSRFLPAIEALKIHTQPVAVAGALDHRLRALTRAPLWIDRETEDPDLLIAARLSAVAGASGEAGGVLEVNGRPIRLRRRTQTAAWFDFDVLCVEARSTADYIDIARQFSVVALSGVPVFDETSDDPARRFIALIDEFYERGVKLIASAAAPPATLYRGERLAAMFERAASRLTEMQSRDYLARPHRP